MHDRTGDPTFLTSRQAAELLGVRRATLYAYVSRGLIRSEEGPGPRARRYRREDVEALRRRRDDQRNPEEALGTALHWGSPLLESAITTFAGGRPFYRGRDAVALAGTMRFEEAVSLVWQADGALDPGRDALPATVVRLLPALDDLGSLERLQAVLPVLAADDPGGWDLRPDAVRRTGAKLLRQMARVVAGSTSNRPQHDRQLDTTGLLADGWGLDPADRSLLDAALVLCLDHELNVSSFTARCVASAGATLHAVVGAGLCALQGLRHGGHTRRVEALWSEAERAPRARDAITERLRRGEEIPGLGQPLYPQGDPRYVEVRRQVAQAHRDHPALRLADELAEAIEELLGERPTIDAGLVLVARVLGLPPDAALTLFALGRTAGWIAHALEQQATGELIRPRARYVGPAPEL